MLSSSTDLCLQLPQRSVLSSQRSLMCLFAYVHKGCVQGFVLMHLLRPGLRARYRHFATVQNVTHHNDESSTRCPQQWIIYMHIFNMCLHGFLYNPTVRVFAQPILSGSSIDWVGLHNNSYSYLANNIP